MCKAASVLGATHLVMEPVYLLNRAAVPTKAVTTRQASAFGLMMLVDVVVSVTQPSVWSPVKRPPALQMRGAACSMESEPAFQPVMLYAEHLETHTTRVLMVTSLTSRAHVCIS